MGRYVTGKNFRYKFAFGDQGSTFGEVLKNITDNMKDAHGCYTTRFVATDGSSEFVRVNVNDKKEFVKAIKKYIGKFKEKSIKQLDDWSRGKVKFSNTYWDKDMMKEYLYQCEDHIKNGETYQYDVEY